MIDVRRISEGSRLDFEVVIREGDGETHHHGTMYREICERLTAGKHTRVKKVLANSRAVFTAR